MGFINKQFIPKDELEDHVITYCYENYLPQRTIIFFRSDY